MSSTTEVLLNYVYTQVLAFKSTGPKFKCVCGSGFDFQDDMEVHQVNSFPNVYIILCNLVSYHTDLWEICHIPHEATICNTNLKFLVKVERTIDKEDVSLLPTTATQLSL